MHRFSTDGRELVSVKKLQEVQGQSAGLCINCVTAFPAGTRPGAGRDTSAGKRCSCPWEPLFGCVYTGLRVVTVGARRDPEEGI